MSSSHDSSTLDRPREARSGRHAPRRRHHGRRQSRTGKIGRGLGRRSGHGLERVPSDMRRDGGVARMSDPEMIQGIQAAVTIRSWPRPVSATSPGADLEALDVDYIDESEVLTRLTKRTTSTSGASRAFVCGATNLGEALRRIARRVLIRSKGEAGTGNVVEAVRHLPRSRQMRRLQSADATNCSTRRRICRRRSRSSKRCRSRQTARPAVLRRWHLYRRPALVLQSGRGHLVGSGNLLQE